MTKLKPSLKNSVRRVLLFNSFLFILISLCGCQFDLEPTYKEKDLPYIVKKICAEEYNIEVTTARTPTTLWIYAPLDKILHEQYGIIKDKIFEDKVAEKLRNILNTIGRVLISSDSTPEFFALLASDINLGLDYTVIGNVLDMKKSHAGFIPWTEVNKRYVIRFESVQEAIGDKTGRHFKPYDIRLEEFLPEQIAQRIELHFRQNYPLDIIQIESVQPIFQNKSFKFYLNIKKGAKSEEEIDIIEEALKIFVFVIQNYNFDDFESVEIHDLNSGKKIDYGRLTLDKL
ncbi:MAG: hypothetical protein ISS45_03445 [Candidatus Omnitrophica bacterium]|nr:hypothetical protein [Candidatus Omnitrophota bacterium]